jgi:uracil-DNA glycosylase family 4
MTGGDRIDALAALAFLVASGADEVLADAPIDFSARGLPAAAAATLARPAPRAAASPPAAAPPAAAPPVAAPPITPPPPRAAPLLSRARAAAEAAATLTELADAIRNFDGMVIRETATNLVFGDGVPGAPVMLVGEAPGAEEDLAGKPFVGRSGQLLDRMFASIGLFRAPTAGQAPLYITNIVTWRPPGNRNPTDEEIAVSVPFCLRHIALAAPRFVVLAGGVPTRALTGRPEGITRLRGRWFELPVPGLAAPVPALATLHPAYLLRQAAAKREAWRDLLLLRARLDDAGAEPG